MPSSSGFTPVPVRAIIDPRRNGETPVNATTLAKFQNAGIPMRQKIDGGVLHWKFIIFNGQNVMQWSAANYGDYYFKPAVPYLDYTDEGIYFTNDHRSSTASGASSTTPGS